MRKYHTELTCDGCGIGGSSEKLSLPEGWESWNVEGPMWRSTTHPLLRQVDLCPPCAERLREAVPTIGTR